MNEKPNMQVHRNGFELLIVCWEPPPISRIHRHRLCIKLDCSESAELYSFNTFAAETPTNRECVFNFIVGAFIPSFVSLACHGSMRFYQFEISVLVLLMFRYEQCLWKCFFSESIVLVLANADNVLLNEYLDHSMSKFKHSTETTHSFFTFTFRQHRHKYFLGQSNLLIGILISSHTLISVTQNIRHISEYIISNKSSKRSFVYITCTLSKSVATSCLKLSPFIIFLRRLLVLNLIRYYSAPHTISIIIAWIGRRRLFCFVLFAWMLARDFRAIRTPS